MVHWRHAKMPTEDKSSLHFLEAFWRVGGMWITAGYRLLLTSLHEAGYVYSILSTISIFYISVHFIIWEVLLATTRK